MPSLLNRDISHLSFNLRVADEADKCSRLGEKVMFHGIARSNLDEFLQVRYPSSINETDSKENEQLVKAIGEHYQVLAARFRKFNHKHKFIRQVKDLSKDDARWAEKYFKQNIYPAVLPVTVDQARHAMIQEGLYVLVITEDGDDESIGYVEIPACISRFIQIPDKCAVIAVEDLVQHYMKSIIHGRKIVKSFPFTIRRSAEVYLQNDQYMDPYKLIEKTLHEREKSWITTLEIGTDKKESIKLVRKLVPVDPNTIVFVTDLVHLADLKSIPSSIYKDSDKPRKVTPRVTFPSENIFDYIRRRDRLCFHPYESYDASVVRFIEEAAADPDVVSIRISLYRVSDHSKIIDALLKAADAGKLVVVLVELKARFDEKHNMQIASIMREGGVRIVYTKPDIKTHAKVCLVSRREKKGLRVYCHVGTGNYSENNSRLYTDYSYLSADPELGADLTQFFNILTSNQGDFKSRKILYAPYNLKSEIIDLIDEQTKRAKNKKHAQITVKCNALTDMSVAQRLIAAADAGVKITLIVRSACIIQPQKNIRIYSIVGQQLEHSRVFVFGSGKTAKVYIGSSDMMTRNLVRRNELMILVEPRELKERILKHIHMYLKDTQNRRVIMKDYKYESVQPKGKKDRYDCQAEFAKEAKRLAIA